MQNDRIGFRDFGFVTIALQDLCAALILLVLLAAVASAPAFAQPGDPCTPSSTITFTSGDRYFLGCGSGNTWASVYSTSDDGAFNLEGALSFRGGISPASIGSHQNNYAPTGFAAASVLRLTASGAYNITGLAGGSNGRVLTITNIGSNTITLKNEDAGSTAGNRFAIGADIALAASQSAVLLYDITSSRWRAMASGGGGGIEQVGGLSAPPYGLSCTRRTATSSAALHTVSCNAGEIMTGGGCTHTSTTAVIEDSGPTANTTWTCEWSAAAATATAYAICCTQQ